MATVLERFNHLGLASSNPVLMKAGSHVATIFHNTHTRSWELIKEKDQVEPDGNKYTVNDYPEDWSKEMDRVIMSFVNSLSNG